MSLTDIPLVNMLREKMSYLNTRQKVISENVANADTPGYEAQDLEEVDFAELVQNGGSSSTMHASSGGGDRYKVIDAPDTEGSVDGSGVSLETQMMKSSETQMEYQSAVSVYRKSINLMRIAIGGGGGQA